MDAPDAPPSPTRRRLLVAGAALGVTAAAGTGAWWKWGRGRTGASASTGSARRSRHVVALLGSPDGPFFTAQELGARLAVEQHNQDARRTVDLVLRTATTAAPQGAPPRQPPGWPPTRTCPW
ncbi:hypothetical protein [Streptomyces aurantiogriseus]|uniref:hypothetical protein n=1 Tax=Streptomyces aurantiogriseus TaxID=66870 RepID=UPI001E2F3CC2|nr:hypothetical protein [Streptomyces aurantiogriseus]